MIPDRALSTALGALVLAQVAVGQAPPRPQATFIQNVAIEAGEGGERASLLLSNGRIEAVLAADAEQPRGTRLVDGEGLLALPGFVDAYARTGLETPEPVKDQDAPVSTESDIRIDMRLANRKGIQPAFRAVESLAIEDKDSEAWREAGFGTVHVAPGGQLLAGSSCVAAPREAAMRDLVLVPEAYAVAAFAASGDGYPSTLMGFIAQLRQFFLDATRHAELERRWQDGQPGARPPFDLELRTGAALVAGEKTLLCVANTHRDVERWLKLADQFGLRIAIAGGNEVWRAADLLAEREIQVVLTLDWGKEVDDPRPDEEEEDVEGEGPAEETEEEDEADASEEPADPEAEEDEDAIEFEYTEPLAVRIERRLEWEEDRDCALRLHEAGVRIAFGTDTEKPGKLLGKVRDLVEAGLPLEVARAALTTDAAAFLGLSGRLGAVAAGNDATLTLWTADPLTEKKAQAAWTFVDGFPTEYEIEEEEEASGEGPAEGVDATGAWTLEVESEEGESIVDLTLEMDEAGAVTGQLSMESPMDGSQIESSVTGQVSGTDLRLEGTLSFGNFQLEVTYELELDGDQLEGEATFSSEAMPESIVRGVSGAREPQIR